MFIMIVAKLCGAARLVWWDHKNIYPPPPFNEILRVTAADPDDDDEEDNGDDNIRSKINDWLSVHGGHFQLFLIRVDFFYRSMIKIRLQLYTDSFRKQTNTINNHFISLIIYQREHKKTSHEAQ